MHDITPFSGSYLPDDIQFLLKPIQIEMTPVEVKEKLIQSGARHYSDMLSQEPAPTEHHLTLFARALDQGATRMAREVVMLAKALINRFGDTPIVLASLVRAGVPLGVMLHHTLRALGKPLFTTVSVSSVTGGLMRSPCHILSKTRHRRAGFVDGWTGKGAITGELTRSLQGVRATPSCLVWWCWPIPVAVLGYLQPMMIGLSRSVLWARQSRGWSPVPSGRKRATRLCSL